MEHTSVSEVGIAGAAVYFPMCAVAQSSLEVHYGVSPGRYTTGLGQNAMSVVRDNEDVVSLAMTALQRLVDKYHLRYEDIGRLEVGTETAVDKSKSVKSFLMSLFVKSGNSDVEGLDNTNACYGSTAALFNVFAWLESSAWDGRVGVVVATDIAVYQSGPARATGGAGAVALLVMRGGDCPLRFEVGLRASHFGHSFDFYKPDVSCEYPTVNGPETVDCFVRALDVCYNAYKRRIGSSRFRIRKDTDYFVCHSPFNKMVQRAFARLLYNDFMDSEPGDDEFRALERYRSLVRDESHLDKDATRAFVAHNKALYESMCEPAAWLAKETGNSYTASLYTSLAALVLNKGDDLVGKRILMFAFGSGFASSMFSLRVVSSVERMQASLGGIHKDLLGRTILPAEAYEELLVSRERDYGKFGVTPQAGLQDITEGAFLLIQIGTLGQRSYGQLRNGRVIEL